MQHGLGVDLANSAFGDAEDLADLRQSQTFVVVERQNQFFALGELLDLDTHDVAEFAILNDGGR